MNFVDDSSVVTVSSGEKGTAGPKTQSRQCKVKTPARRRGRSTASAWSKTSDEKSEAGRSEAADKVGAKLGM